MKKVTFQNSRKVKEGRKMVLKTFEIVEYTEADQKAIELRAMALNWQLVKVEEVPEASVPLFGRSV